LRVTQLYRLDARSRKAGGSAEAVFSCALGGRAGEVGFGIPRVLPGGLGFVVVVEAPGARPWLLPMLLAQQGTAWKMAGFSPHARSVGGHDGLWYWTTARADAKAGKKWLGGGVDGAGGPRFAP